MQHNLPIKIDLPDHFLDEEIRAGYTVSSLMKKVWAVEIDLLFEFIRICNKYGLKWYMGGGSMLGTVRHKGYIPWDDDIDLNLFRKDYDKFCEVAKNEIMAPYYFTDGTKDKGVFRAYAQIYNTNTTCIMANSVNVKRSFNQGISIDIFPIDNVPDNSRERAEFTKKVDARTIPCRWLYGHVGYYLPKKNEGIIARCKHVVAVSIARIIWPLFHSKWSNQLLDLMRKYQDVTTTEMIADLSMAPFEERRLWKREWYKETLKMPFEWFLVNVPSGYDQWLTKHYGYWKCYEKGTALHLAAIYDPEKPYTEYNKN